MEFTDSKTEQCNVIGFDNLEIVAASFVITEHSTGAGLVMNRQTEQLLTLRFQWQGSPLTRAERDSKMTWVLSFNRRRRVSSRFCECILIVRLFLKTQSRKLKYS